MKQYAVTAVKENAVDIVLSIDGVKLDHQNLSLLISPAGYDENGNLVVEAVYANTEDQLTALVQPYMDKYEEDLETAAKKQETIENHPFADLVTSVDLSNPKADMPEDSIVIE